MDYDIVLNKLGDASILISNGCKISWMMNEIKHVSYIKGLAIFIHPNFYRFLY